MKEIVIFLFLLFASPDPHFTALWDTSTSATVQWTQTEYTCLSVTHATKEFVGIECYDRVGTITVTLGHVGPLSGNLRPLPGDVYTLSNTSGAFASAPLVGRRVFLPVFRR